MKLTDLFIRRPVLAIVVNLVILIAGLQAIRSLNVRQYPRSDIAVDQGDHGLRRRQRRPGARLHHHAARAGDRARRRHRLHRVAERPGPVHDHRAPEAQLRHQRRADPDQAKVAQVRDDLPPEAEAPIIELEPADAQFAADVPQLLVEGPRPEPDHRLPDPRRAAAAVRGRRRAARRHPGRPHLRHARLAEARADGGARHLALRRSSRRWPPTTTSPPSARPRARWSRSTWSPTPTSRRVEEFRSSWSRRTTGVVVRLGDIADVVLGAENYDQDVRFNGEDGDLHGRLGAAHRQLPGRDRPGARGDAGDPGAAAGRHEGAASPTTRRTTSRTRSRRS